MKVTHTHEYKYWHAHKHCHAPDTREESVAVLGLKGLSSSCHDTGHFHTFAQNHEHGHAGDSPHSHKDRQYHPQSNDKLHHHAVADHEE